KKRTAWPRKSNRSATDSGARAADMPGLPPIKDVLDEFQLVDAHDRCRLLIALGRKLEPMPDALKTDATMVRGCSASVWVYPTAKDGRLHFLAASHHRTPNGLVPTTL